MAAKSAYLKRKAVAAGIFANGKQSPEIQGLRFIRNSAAAPKAYFSIEQMKLKDGDARIFMSTDPRI